MPKKLSETEPDVREDEPLWKGSLVLPVSMRDDVQRAMDRMGLANFSEFVRAVLRRQLPEVLGSDPRRFLVRNDSVTVPLGPELGDLLTAVAKQLSMTPADLARAMIEEAVIEWAEKAKERLEKFKGLKEQLEGKGARAKG